MYGGYPKAVCEIFVTHQAHLCFALFLQDEMDWGTSADGQLKKQNMATLKHVSQIQICKERRDDTTEVAHGQI